MFNAICLGFYGLQEDIITSVTSNIHIYMDNEQSNTMRLNIFSSYESFERCCFILTLI